MIDDWRAKWYTSSYGNTDPMFPFGFVQALLSADGTSNVTVGGFPTIRWAQTANYGYVPNPHMQNIFMAVSMDLRDPTSPYDSIHPRDKLDVGARLALAARGVAYKETDVYFTGAIATGATLIGLQLVTVVVDFTSVGPSGLDLLYPYGFEVQCSGSTSLLEGTAVKVDGGHFRLLDEIIR
ncbi:hypothetical protein EMCRGX_G028820 [Ephydatia muelleri]